jgi:putative methyltransferase (TIGR04325 family)
MSAKPAAVIPAETSWPLLRGLQRKRYEKAFAENRDANLFRGVFPSFEAAQASAPKSLPLGYDNPASAEMYMDRTRKVYASDYPILFWLDRLFREGVTSVFDLGGHIGVSYYAYRRFLTYPKTLRWVVHDVPAVVRHGRELAPKMDRDGYLGFSDGFEGADGFDVLFASGSVQYLPETLATRLARLKQAPRHILLNLLPVHERETYFTLQSVGTAFCPYRIASAESALADYQALGYTLVDTWENPEKSCLIPFHPEHSLDRYFGFYFRRS